MKSKNLIIISVCIAVSVAAVICFIPNDKKKISKQFDRVAEYMHKSGNENILIDAGKGKAVSKLLTDPCQINLETRFSGNANGSYSRDQSAMMVVSARSMLSTISLSFHDMAIELEGKERARVRLSVRIKGSMNSGGPFSEVKEVICDMVKIDKKWLFEKCKAVEVFKK